MNDQELDAAIAAAFPDDGQVGALDLAGADLALREAIMVQTEIRPTLAPVHPLRRRGWRAAGLAAVAAALVAALVVVVPGASRDGSAAWAAPVLAVAESAPRYLLAQEGWVVTQVPEFSGASGQVVFSDGEATIDLHWRPASTHDEYVADRSELPELEGMTATADGVPARVFTYGDTDGGTDLAALWRQGDHSLEARGVVRDAAAFAGLLAALEEVDVDAWLTALPEQVVRPDGERDAIAGMLADVPLPPGFDPRSLERGAAIDRYQVGAQATGAVACGWIESWIAASSRGDAAAAQEAVDAMATSRDWAILQEMDAEGDFPEVVWEHADAMAADGTLYGYPVADGYRAAFGCG